MQDNPAPAKREDESQSTSMITGQPEYFGGTVVDLFQEVANRHAFAQKDGTVRPTQWRATARFQETDSAIRAQEGPRKLPAE
jgi:hypothetical protein